MYNRGIKIVEEEFYAAVAALASLFSQARR